MIGLIASAQRWFERSCYGAGYALSILFSSLRFLPQARKKRQEIIAQLFLATFGSMPIITITALFAGMILSLQAGIELARFGQQGAIGAIVAASICREMGPVFTALPLAGLIGSTYAAEIGTMKVSEEIDALEVMSIDPVFFLVLPRVIALSIGAVTMTIFADLIGVLGGGLVARAILHVDFDLYLKGAKDVIKLKDIYGGLVKALVFGLTIATVSCGQGLRAENGAEGVGKATLRAVVVSFIMILMFDYFLTWMIY
jgi:phospholipid/cholesterol/gamma-HCH transport system permease protein